MVGEWKSVPLGEVYEFSSGLSKPRSAFGSGYPFLGFKDVFYNSSVPERLTELVNSTDQERSRCSIKRGDVFVTRTSETMDELGMSSVALRDIPNATFNGFTKRLRPRDPDTVVPEYARYYFRSSAFRNAVTAMSTLSTRASLNNEMLARIYMVLPPPKEQEVIGGILCTLDDKIELNRRMNETLEAMARALFKSWFVDFDPVRAKAEGRDTGLAKEIDDLFPDSFDDTELGEVPKGWRVGVVSDLSKVTSGKRPDVRFANRSQDAFVPLWGGNGPMAFVPEPLFNEPLLLTGRVGTLGSVFRITGPCWPSDNTLVVLANRPADLEYLFFQLRRIDFASLNRGSTQPLLTQSDLKSQRLLIPVPPVLNYFSRITNSFYKHIDHAEEESHTLTALRNVLLPRLLSGGGG